MNAPEHRTSVTSGWLPFLGIHGIAQALGYRLENFITNSVPILIIDWLEPVEIQRENGALADDGLGLLSRVIKVARLEGDLADMPLPAA